MGNNSLNKRFSNWECKIYSTIYAPNADTYVFYILADNGAKLWIDGNAVIDDTGTACNKKRSQFGQPCFIGLADTV